MSHQQTESPYFSREYFYKQSRRGGRWTRVLIAGVALLTAIGFLYSISDLYHPSQYSHHDEIHDAPSQPEHIKAPLPTTDVSRTFSGFLGTLKHPITASSYTDEKGDVFETSKDGPWWTEPLGKQVLIIDIDTRLPDGKNQLWSNDRLDWESIEQGGNGVLTASQLNHYLYAQIHGYDYRFFHAQELEGLHNTWVKPHVLHEMLPKYKFVAFVDGDALVKNLDVPLEWMFNRWGVTPQTAIAVPLDVRMFGGEGDSRGQSEVNTGFVVVQNTPLAGELLTAWKECPYEKRYKGCSRWKEEWSHEQRAFSEYIRYDPQFNSSKETIVQISCDDAMGFPGLQDADFIVDKCKGNFVRHHTINKPETIRRTELSIVQMVVDLARKDILKNRETYRIDETKSVVEDQSRNQSLGEAKGVAAEGEAHNGVGIIDTQELSDDNEPVLLIRR